MTGRGRGQWEGMCTCNTIKKVKGKKKKKIEKNFKTVKKEKKHKKTGYCYHPLASRKHRGSVIGTLSCTMLYIGIQQFMDMSRDASQKKELRT